MIIDKVNRANDGLFSNTLFGISTLQTYADLRLWEWVLSNHPTKSVIEIGTGNGGLSIFLAIQAYMRGQRFVTLDWHACSHLKEAPLPIQQIHGDMWTPEVQKQIKALIDDPALHPMLFFCDGGNKPREFQAFTPWLWPGDIVGVHDWMTEFGPADAEPVRHLLDDLLPDALYKFPDSFTRFYLKK